MTKPYDPDRAQAVKYELEQIWQYGKLSDALNVACWTCCTYASSPPLVIATSAPKRGKEEDEE